MASAVLPTRQQRNEPTIRRKSKTDNEILMQMGFPKQRVQKAVAATGDRGVQLASDWLLSHVNDPNLDKNIPREYIFYLCPVGDLQKQIAEFDEKSLAECGWNGSHAYFPHITLSPFFTVEDSNVEAVSEAVLKMENKLRQFPSNMKLEFFSQMNFIGLFLQEDSYKFLSELMTDIGTELKKSGIKVDPHKKQLHLTLAYQYQSEHHEKLLAMAKKIDIAAEVKWDFRLYSRDATFSNCEARKVIKAYVAQLDDELELIDGDFIYVEPKEIANSKDDWYKGTSWLTGNSGYFPGTYTQKVAETVTWVLHRALPLTSSKQVLSRSQNGADTQELYDNLWHNENDYAVVKKKNKKKVAIAIEKPREPRKLFVMRHGERVDFALGKDWHEMCFDDNGRYSRDNLNLPKVLPDRKTYLEFIKDPPLSEIGKYQARLTAQQLYENQVTFFCIYASPSLRCIETATEVFKVYRLPWKLRIEPGLFEWTGHVAGIPRWMSVEEMANAGYPVDTTYTPQVPLSSLVENESVDLLYTRSTETTRQILMNHEGEGGNLLFVGHTGTLELCTRVLLGLAPRNLQQYKEILPKVPYCGICAVQEDSVKKRWAFIDSTVLSFTHGRNTGQKILPLLK